MAYFPNTDDFITNTLFNYNQKLAANLGADVLILKAPMMDGVDTAVRREIEAISEFKESQNIARDRLAVMLETTGGSIEVVERLANVFRHHYGHVSFIVPNHAYSAGTVLVMSGDEIYMDYYSVLGPIDPQIQNREGRWVPGTGFLQKYKQMIEKDGKEGLTNGEINYLVSRFDPAELFFIEQAIHHSKALITEWLPQYKFKSWKKHASTGKTVTMKTKKARAGKIARALGDANRWYSHGRGITIKDLESDVIGLQIRSLDDPAIGQLKHDIKCYFELFLDYCYKQGAQFAVHGVRAMHRLG